MALIDSFILAHDPRMIDQVTAAIEVTASNVYSEASTIAGHTTRAAFATKVSSGSFDLQPYITQAVVQGNLTITSTDTAVENAVSSLWNEWAGV